MELSNAYLILLWGGIILFVLAVIVVVVNLRRHDSITPATVLFAIALVMIVFPALKSISIAGIEMEVKKQTDALNKNAGDTTAQRRLNDALKKVGEQGSGARLTKSFSMVVARADSQLVRIATQAMERIPLDSTHATSPAERAAAGAAAQILSQRVDRLSPTQLSALQKARALAVK